MNMFVSMLDEAPRTLDAGCGFKPWRELFKPETKYLGIDYSSEWSFPDALASLASLPFLDNSFDAVICSEVLEHTRYPETCVNELRRVCRPGGLIYISTPFAFHEHGVPYDYQRPTQFFYREVFKNDEIICLHKASSTMGSVFTIINCFVECTPLRAIWGFRQVQHLISNLLAIIVDGMIEFFARLIRRKFPVDTDLLPLGYNMIIRVKED